MIFNYSTVMIMMMVCGCESLLAKYHSTLGEETSQSSVQGDPEALGSSLVLVFLYAKMFFLLLEPFL